MIGKRLKELRLEKGLRQQDLAKILNVSSMSISFYENEQRKPDSEFIVAVSKYFDVSSDYLLGLTNAKNKENIDISKVTGLNDFSITILEQSLKETNNVAAEIIDKIICTGAFLRLVDIIDEKNNNNNNNNNNNSVVDIDFSDILDIKVSEILKMNREQRRAILNKVFPLYKFDIYKLRNFQIEKYIDEISEKLKENYLELVTSVGEI